MAEWTTLPLPDVLDFREGPGILARDFRDSGVPLIRLAGLKRNSQLLTGCNFLDPDMVDQRWNQFRVLEGDVLLSTSASLGEVATVDASAVGAVPYTGIIRFRPRNGRVRSEFISHMLTAPSFKKQIEAMGVGSVMRHFGPSHLRQMTVDLPRKNVQQQIAAILGALDDKIAVNERISSVVDSLLSALGESALSAPEAQRVTVDQVASVNQATTKPAKEGWLRYVDISSVRVGSYDWPDRMSWAEAPGRARRKAAVGDTVWSTVRPNRRSHAFVLDNDPELVFSTGLAVLSPHSTGPATFYEATRRAEFQDYLESVAEGSAYPAVRADRFKKAPIMLPPKEEIARFEAKAMQLRLRAQKAAEESRALAALRDTLLPQLMSGKLRVRDAERIVEDAV